MSKRDLIEDIYPLSPMQESLLVHSLYAPASPAHFIQWTCKLSGDLDVEAFEQAWRRVVDRHGALRTAFVTKRPDRPLQVVQRRARLEYRREDWRSLPSAEQSRYWRELLDEDRRRGFELSRPPLMRTALARVSDREYRFVWSHHHLLLDGWSLPLVRKEVMAIYDALRHGTSSSLEPERSPPHPALSPRGGDELRDRPAETPRPYGEFIAWLAKRDAAADERFWREELRGVQAPTPIRLAVREEDLAPPEMERFGEEEIRLSAELSQQLRTFAQQCEVTVNTIVQGAWAILLGRYSRRDDVVFGATVSGRPAELASVESMIGLFINNLPVRVLIRGEESLLAWLKRLQAHQVPLHEHEHTPLAKIQEWSDVPAGWRLFETLLVFENYPEVGATGLAGGVVIEESHAGAVTGYPLTVVVVPGRPWQIALHYDERRFDRAAAARLLSNFQALLSALVEDRERNLGALPRFAEEELPLVSPAETLSVLRAHPAVADAQVVVRDNGSAGGHLAAYIVSVGSVESSSRTALRRYLKARLPEALVPSEIAFVDSLEEMEPSNGVNSLASRYMPQRSAIAAAQREGLLARNEVEGRIQQIWEQLLGTHPVGVHDDFFELGGRSVTVVRMLGELESSFLRTLPMARFFEKPTIEHLASVLCENQPAQDVSPLVPLQAAGAEPPFFCVHSDGGAVLVYSQLARHMRPDFPLYGLQAQGLHGEKPPLETISEMAGRYIEAMATVQRQGPYHLGGLGLGGVVAFEMAVQLQAAGEQVGLLALIDSQRPVAAGRLAELVSRSRYGRRLVRHGRNLLELGMAERAEYVVRKLGDIRRRKSRRAARALAGSIAPQAETVHVHARTFYSVYGQGVHEANKQALARYRPKPRAGKVTFFLGEETLPRLGRSHDPEHWRELALGGLEICLVPNIQCGILAEPHVRVLAERLKSHLRAAHSAALAQSSR